jgi:dTDP-4-dehydrorhamnose reductase
LKVLVLGEGGQLSTELLSTQRKKGIELHQWGRKEWDLERPEAIEDLLKNLRPDVVINAAAYTAVDRAEEEEGKAYGINALAVEALAKACATCNCRLLQVSTDFVFDGTASVPYLSTDTTSPLGVYGMSKRKGEESVLKHLPRTGVIIRTSWLYSAHGNNFVKTMLRLMKEKDSLGVVSDQRGCPTWARGLAECLWDMCEANQLSGVYHWCDEGVISWHDFAVAIQEEAFSLGILEKKIPVGAISTEEYPTPARRPSFSAMDCSSTVEGTGVAQRPWRDSLIEMLISLKAQG